MVIIADRIMACRAPSSRKAAGRGRARFKTRWRSVCSNDHSWLTCSASAAAGSRPARSMVPQPLDGVPHRSDVVGRLPFAELHAFRVPPVQFGADEFGHVDAVDRDVAEVAGDADVDQPAVPDGDAGQVTVGEPGAAQVRGVELGAPEFRAAATLARVEPVRSELRLCRFIWPGDSQVGRIVGCCHGPDSSGS
jgi:hypothetical protein